MGLEGTEPGRVEEDSTAAIAKGRAVLRLRACTSGQPLELHWYQVLSKERVWHTAIATAVVSHRSALEPVIPFACYSGVAEQRCQSRGNPAVYKSGGRVSVGLERGTT